MVIVNLNFIFSNFFPDKMGVQMPEEVKVEDAVPTERRAMARFVRYIIFFVNQNFAFS